MYALTAIDYATFKLLFTFPTPTLVWAILMVYKATFFLLFIPLSQVLSIVILSCVPACLLNITQKVPFLFHLSTYWQVPSSV